MNVARIFTSLALVAAVSFGSAAGAQAKGHKKNVRHHTEAAAPVYVSPYAQKVPAFDGGCNPALHVRFGNCPTREFMWNHMHDGGKMMLWTAW